MAGAVRRSDLVERHSVALAAPLEVALAAAKAVTPREARLAGLLLRLRGLPASPDLPIYRQLLDVGFVAVRESESELVVEAAGEPWRFRGGSSDASYVRMTLRIAADGSRLSTETTVEATDDAARRRFRRYWLVIRPFSGMVRRSWLGAAARRALGAA